MRLTKTQEITKRAAARRAHTVKARDVSPSHHVDQGASPMARLHQMEAQHQQQQLLENELRDFATKFETPSEVAVWVGVVRELAVDTARVAEAVPRTLRQYLPETVQTAIEARVHARVHR